ncbi:putative aspergillopepsin, partial [Aureobasidium melanogenum]
MKLTTAFLTSLLSASTVIAAPGTAMRRKRAESARAGLLKAPKPFIAATNVTAVVHGPENKQVSYSNNWAGGVLEGSGWKTVTGTFTIPKVTLPPGGSSRTLYSASAWVGIDGYSCESAILQTGVDFSIQGGAVTYDAWYEWYPDYAYDFSGISFSAGDSVTVTVTASSTTGGVATIKNNSKGTHSLQTDAEWIVEDFTQIENGEESLVPLVDFGTITFTGASATTNSGSKYGPSSADVIDLISADGETVLTDVTVGSSSVSVVYE